MSLRLSSTLTPPPAIGGWDVTSLLKDGVVAAKEGNKVRARILFRRAVEVVPEHETAWLWLANLAESVAETVECLRRVLAINPENALAKKSLPEALIRAGIEAANAKDNSLAWEFLLEATELDPTNEQALIWLSGVAAAPKEGLDILYKVLELNPQNEAALTGIQHYERELRECWTCPLCLGKAEGPEQGRCPKCHSVLVLDPPELFDTPSEHLERNALENNLQVMMKDYELKQESEVAFLIGLVWLNLGNDDEGFNYLKASLSPRAANPKWPILVPSFIKYRKTVASQRAAAEENKRLTGRTKGTILVVTDRVKDRAILSLTLTMAGHTVVEADSAESIAKRIRDTGVPSLFVLDSALPAVGGYSVAEVLKQNPETSRVPIVPIGGKKTFLNKLSRQNTVLSFPIDPDLLLKCVKAALR